LASKIGEGNLHRPSQAAEVLFLNVSPEHSLQARVDLLDLDRFNYRAQKDRFATARNFGLLCHRLTLEEDADILTEDTLACSGFATGTELFWWPK
jgi:hypothetical protein